MNSPVPSATEPLVSVVLCTSDSERFIGATLDTIVGQSYKNLEILILDNASTDTTVEIVGRYMRVDPRIRLIKSDRNLGAFEGLNRLLDQCRGEYVAVIDHDDLWPLDKLRSQVTFLESNSAFTGCGGLALMWFERTGMLLRAKYRPWDGDVQHTTLLFRNRPEYRYDVSVPYKTDPYFMKYILGGVKGKLFLSRQYLCIHRMRSDGLNLTHTSRTIGAIVRTFFRDPDVLTLIRGVVLAILPVRFTELYYRVVLCERGHVTDIKRYGYRIPVPGLTHPRTSGSRCLRVCIICMQILGYEKIGGFGSMTRSLARALVHEGCAVTVLIPWFRTRTMHEQRDGYEIFRVPFLSAVSKDTYRRIGADIYHSQNPSIFSWFAQYAEPSKAHIITCRDPRSIHDWMTTFRYATWRRRMRIPFNYLTEESYWAREAVRRADAVGVPAYFLKDRAVRLYGLKHAVRFLPNIEDVPDIIPKKASSPTVCFVGRLDRLKRPELFIKLAAHFPQVRFLIVGVAEEKGRQRDLERLARRWANVTMAGFVDKFDDDRLTDVYRSSWILVNTSVKEGLPLTFIEALSYGCALVSSLNPDGVVSRFGAVAQNDDYRSALSALLTGDSWRMRGKAGYAYVYERYRKEIALLNHLDLYTSVCARKPTVTL